MKESSIIIFLIKIIVIIIHLPCIALFKILKDSLQKEATEHCDFIFTPVNQPDCSSSDIYRRVFMSCNLDCQLDLEE